MANVDRISLSLPADLVRRARAAADEDQSALSAWFAEAAEIKLLHRNAERVIAVYEADHGVITEEELKRLDEAWKA